MTLLDLNGYQFPYKTLSWYNLPVNFGMPFNFTIPPLFQYGIPRYTLYDNNIFNFTPPINFCYIPPLNYTSIYNNKSGGLFDFLKTPLQNPYSTGIFTNPRYSTNTTYNFSSRYPDNRGTPTKAIINKALTLARGELGVRENGSSNNSTAVNKYRFGRATGQPWCASFTSWIFGAGQQSNNSRTFGYDASSQSIKHKAQNAGCYHKNNSGYTPKAGDLMILSYSGGKGHIGIVDKVNKDGSFEAIEGNSGDAVNRVKRTLSSVNGFVDMEKWLNQTATA